MRILVTGRTGQLAQSLAERGTDIDWICVGRSELNLEEPGAFARAIDHFRPDFVINAAAYTSVDQAEVNDATAFQVNAESAREGAQAAATMGIPFLQISTDYVFDGSGTRAWREDDPVSPINVYGRSKAAGEKYVLEACQTHIVVRTSWLFSPFGHNFVKTMLRLAEEKEEVSVVADQRGCPTSTLDLADALIDLVRKPVGSNAGVWHMAGDKAASWAEFAEEIYRVSASQGGATAHVRKVTGSEFPTLAKRPKNSVLDCGKARSQLSISVPSWHASLPEIVSRLLPRMV